MSEAKLGFSKEIKQKIRVNIKTKEIDTIRKDCMTEIIASLIGDTLEKTFANITKSFPSFLTTTYPGNGQNIGMICVQTDDSYIYFY